MRARLRADGTALVPGLLGLAILVYWAAAGGGYESLPGSDTSYDPNPWFLGALAILGLLAVTVAGLGPRHIRLSRLSIAALACLGLYAAFSYASILWAQSPGDAFTGANRALVYFAFFALFAILPWTARGALLALGVLVAALGVVAVVQTVRIGTLPHPRGLYADGRLATPLDYQNANAALFTILALVALGLGARREVPWYLRGPALALAGLGLQLAVLCESRGWLFTLPLVLLAMLLAVPNRMRLALFAVGPAIATAAVLDPLLAVFRAGGYHGVVQPLPAIDRALAEKGAPAAHAMLLAGLVLLVVGLLAAWADSRISLSARTSRLTTRIAAGLAVLVLLGGAGAGLASVHGGVGPRIDHAWQSFKNFKRTQNDPTYFTHLGSSRYDLWRVGLDVWAKHPLGGIGQDNFTEAYVAQRRSTEQPRWTHSLEVRLLTHTGIIGAALLLAFLACALWCAARSGRRRGPEARAAAGVALVPLAVWLLHGSVDWLWEYPALSGIALGLLGLSVSLGRPSERALGRSAGAVAPLRSPRRGVRAALAAVGALAAALALLLLALPYIGERDVNRAIETWRADPPGAFAALHRAAALEPLNAQPAAVGGAIAIGLGRPELVREQFSQVAERNPRSWLAAVFLGLVDGRRDRRLAALELERASALDPENPLSRHALAALRRGHPMTIDQAVIELNANYRFRR